MIKALELGISLAMTTGIYYPAFKRILKRKHTRDFSKTSALFIFLVQVNQFALAVAEHAHYMMVWYVIQSILTGLNLYMIHHYWNTEEPRWRSAAPTVDEPKNSTTT